MSIPQTDQAMTLQDVFAMVKGATFTFENGETINGSILPESIVSGINVSDSKLDIFNDIVEAVTAHAECCVLETDLSL